MSSNRHQKPRLRRILEEAYKSGSRDGDIAFTAKEFDQVSGEYDALTNMPCAGFAAELAAAYPDAKIILNKRIDVDTWYKSFDATMMANRRDGGPTSALGSRRFILVEAVPGSSSTSSDCTLTYSIKRPGCPAKTDTLSTADYPEHDYAHIKIEGAELEDGEDVSANGFAIIIVKNEGSFEVKFRGDAGTDVDWVFIGHNEVSGVLKASTCVQTSILVQNEGTQTEDVKTKEMPTQTYHSIDPKNRPGKGQSCIRRLRPHKDVGVQAPEKRPRTDDPYVPHKRARTTHDGEPWPRHLYMEARRVQPSEDSECGLLHIDLMEAKVFFNSWTGAEHHREYKEKQVALVSPRTKVSYELRGGDWPKHQHHLTISRYHQGKDRDNETIMMLQLRRDASRQRIISSDEAISRDELKLDNHDGTVVSGAGPKMVVDAIAHCIDRVSGRGAVHDPEGERSLRLRRNAAIRKQNGRSTLNDVRELSEIGEKKRAAEKLKTCSVKASISTQ
ncbi:hypothetical protein P171DRAFT_524702 [Karstenula rhodostoma CBS 690.94]|uniref:Uncharacterized protein n=1 Tax=Karstenula rhodostoma CBS 690.94 TaxID=1392251 RepID=A0A9P4P961_9PLEO|nr:hypothetical protein P171DRAFT_524702 [Karstenula rhodostoma CBS 690.94]